VKKLKTRKSAAKRYKVTASGKVCAICVCFISVFFFDFLTSLFCGGPKHF